MTIASRFVRPIVAAALVAGLSTAAIAANPMVGGAPMYATKNIVENAVNSKDHTTLVAAVKAAGLVETLQGEGPFTVLAPTNAAFGKLPDGTVDTVLMPENKGMLTGILTYHVIPGKLSAKNIMDAIAEKGGQAEFKTVEGETVKFTQSGKTLMVTDAKGGMAKITIANVDQSNGVIHVIDGVLMP
ncbi:fasciclin domain-containing protein [Chthonobacter albigriseus]|uniref:fasciclin domain-containing protein n=1 Tax=Chthonobacter albigriseus TaxID=1683161 RepID=UPI0015EEBA69|nr:fasciclin domain-containing protein [Chthonobacter albigriseus]